MSLNATPSGDRIHFALFGKRNAGKSSVIYAMTNQELAIVSDVKGTTTDPVYKAMELLPLGPVVMIDTPGLDDEGELFTYYNGIQGAGGKAEKDPISTSPSEDAKLVSIINQIGTNNRYSLVGYNCQKWYKEVVDAFNKEKHNRDRLPILDRREIPKKIVTDHFFNRSMDAHYYGYNQNWDEKSPILDVVP